MAVLAKIPTTDIHWVDIRDTLNANGGSVTGEFRTAYIESANINPFSKRKPVRKSVNFCFDDPVWWKAENGFCGFNASGAQASSWTELVAKYDGGDNGWVYELPIGGTSSPFRMDDFGGYYPNAKNQLSGVGMPDTIYTDQGSVSFAINLPAVNDNELTWLDFDELKNYYFGVLIYSSRRWYRATATETLANGGTIVFLSAATLVEGGYTIYPFISSASYTQTEGDKSMRLYTLPQAKPESVTVKKTAIIIFPGAQKINATETVEWSVQVRNDTSSAITFENNSLRIGRDRQMQMAGDYTNTIPTVTVGAGENKIIASGVARISYRDYDFATTMLFINVSLGGGKYSIIAPVAEDFENGGNGDI